MINLSSFLLKNVKKNMRLRRTNQSKIHNMLYLQNEILPFMVDENPRRITTESIKHMLT